MKRKMHNGGAASSSMTSPRREGEKESMPKRVRSTTDEDDKENSMPMTPPTMMGPPAPPSKKKPQPMTISPVARPPRSPRARFSQGRQSGSHNAALSTWSPDASPQSTMVRTSCSVGQMSPKSTKAQRQPRRITRSLLSQMNSSATTTVDTMHTPPHAPKTSKIREEEQRFIRRLLVAKTEKSDALQFCRRVLRSNDRQRDQVDRAMTARANGLGTFCALPAPVIHDHLFEQADVPTLCALAATSKMWQVLVVNYFHSVSFMRKLVALLNKRVLFTSTRDDSSGARIRTRFTQPAVEYDHMGLVIKTVMTLHYRDTPKEDMMALKEYMERFFAVSQTFTPPFRPNTLGIGRTLMTFLRGWSPNSLSTVWPKLFVHHYGTEFMRKSVEVQKFMAKGHKMMTPQAHAFVGVGRLTELVPKVQTGGGWTVNDAIYRLNTTMNRHDMAQGIAMNGPTEMFVRNTFTQLLLSPNDLPYDGAFALTVDDSAANLRKMGNGRLANRYGSTTGMVPCSPTTHNYALWLSRVLDMSVNPLQMRDVRYAKATSAEHRVRQAYMMNVICAPLLIGNVVAEEHNDDRDAHVVIDWSSLCNRTVTSPSDARRRLGPFVRAMVSLYNAAVDDKYKHLIKWGITDLFALVEETTTFPEPWALESFAILLLMMRSVGVKVLTQRISYGHLEETANIMCALKTVVHRWRHNRDGHLWVEAYSNLFNNVLFEMPTVAKRHNFNAAIHKSSFARQMDLYGDTAPEAERIEELQSQTWMTTKFEAVVMSATVRNDLVMVEMETTLPSIMSALTIPLDDASDNEWLPELPDAME